MGVDGFLCFFSCVLSTYHPDLILIPHLHVYFYSFFIFQSNIIIINNISSSSSINNNMYHSVPSSSLLTQQSCLQDLHRFQRLATCLLNSPIWHTALHQDSLSLKTMPFLRREWRAMLIVSLLLLPLRGGRTVYRVPVLSQCGKSIIAHDVYTSNIISVCLFRLLCTDSFSTMNPSKI